MRLSTEKAIEFVENLEKYHPIQKYWDESNERHRQEKNTENYPYSYFRGVLIRKIAEIIEALQQENEQLKDENASIRNWNACEEKLHNELLESDKRRWELESELEDANNYREGLEAIVDKLREQVKTYVEAKIQDYHNPADVEALRKAREAIQRAKENFEPYGEYEYDVRYDLEEALAEIDKAIGGGDVDKG